MTVFRGRRGHATVFLLSGLAATTILGWTAFLLPIVGMDSPAMGVMLEGPESIELFLFAWGIMMVAMMFPSAAPMAQAYVNLCVEKVKGSKWVTPQAAIFLGSYVVVWTLVGLGIAGIYLLLSEVMAMLSLTGSWQTTLAGLVLVGAGLYQVTPLKRVCLTACRSPLSFLVTRWRPGMIGAASLGLHHATYCVGCCWALFIVLFAVGLMSLPWMSLLALVIFVEKTLPYGLRTSYWIGMLFVLVGGSFILFPEWARLVVAEH